METGAIGEKERFRHDARARRLAFVSTLSAAQRTEFENSIAAQAGRYIATAHVLASYAPMSQEVDPTACLTHVRSNAIIALPWFENRNSNMLFREIDGENVRGPFGTLQPPAIAPACAPDVILVPLVAADTQCNRLGQGKGHFDRALMSLRQHKPLRAIGLAWDMQIVDSIPIDSWDEPLDMIITPTRTILSDAFV